MTYDRDTVVRGIERYYELLAKLAYIEESEIIRPPPTGWTDDQLLMDMLVSAGRSDKVLDLVRHLPYLRCDRELEVYPPCRYVSYLREEADEDALSPETAKDYFHLQLMPFGDEIKTPANMVVLASDLNADAWVLDVDKGVIYQCDSTLYDEDAPEEEPWRQFGQRMDAKRFLDKVYSHVNNLILIPIPEPFPWFEGGNGPKARRLKRLLTENGWPENLHKEAYLNTLREYAEAERARMAEEDDDDDDDDDDQNA